MLKITVEYKGVTHTEIVDDHKLLAMENDLFDSGDLDSNTVLGWLVWAIRGKINNCSKRMARAETARLTADPGTSTMPASEDGLINSAKAAPNYMNRREREAARPAGQ